MLQFGLTVQTERRSRGTGGLRRSAL